MNRSIRRDRLYPEYWSGALMSQRLYPGHPVAGTDVELMAEAMRGYRCATLRSGSG